MKLSSKNWFARYYNWIYDELPNDICSFFWGSVLAIGLFPILVIGRLLTPNYNHEFGKVLGYGILFYVVYGVATLLGVTMYISYVLDVEKVVLSEHYPLFELSWYGLLFGMPLITVGVVIVIFLAIGILIALLALIFKGFGVAISASQRTTLVQNTKDVVGAVRGRYCTHITWKK